MFKREDVEKIAELSKLKLTEEEIEKFTTQLSNIAELIANLKKIDTSDKEPLYSPCEQFFVRGDVVKEFDNKKGIFNNSPFEKEGRIVVPKVVS